MEFSTAGLGFIKAGETWAIVGNSNSGHSELLRRINGSGVELVSFRHNFRNLSNTTDFYYQQRFNSMDSEDALTVHEYLLSQQSATPGLYWNYGKVVSELRLQNLLSEQVIKLSNGETKRLLIASALIRQPRILLLDHPLTGLDKQMRTALDFIIGNIIESGIQVVMATTPGEIPGIVTHVAVMQNNEVTFADRRSSYQPSMLQAEEKRDVDLALLKSVISQDPLPHFDTIVRMTDVNVVYDGKKILSHLTWHIKQGERWSVTGPNGAGKSTLLSLVNADNPQAYANNIVLFDRKRGTGESIWDIKGLTGFVSPELFQYFPTGSSCLHVIESGFYDTVGLFRPSDPAKEAIAIQWMKFFDAEKYVEHLFSSVPLPIQRLCLLSRALVKNPALLILDEPTQGLDDNQQKFFTRLIDQICEMTNVTLIYVSHYEHHIPSSVNKHLKLQNGMRIPD
jgi:molybdate transport system ATP-binding protein